MGDPTYKWLAYSASVSSPFAKVDYLVPGNQYLLAIRIADNTNNICAQCTSEFLNTGAIPFMNFDAAKYELGAQISLTMSMSAGAGQNASASYGAAIGFNKNCYIASDSSGAFYACPFVLGGSGAVELTVSSGIYGNGMRLGDEGILESRIVLSTGWVETMMGLSLNHPTQSHPHFL
ncbi:hypothetical protein BC830DRAFT_412633 [Chytriomyces sp. MP71]|nr:hypothetical protein BC830DRAFT_412633 [Chytriomyces sp. MP71]